MQSLNKLSFIVFGVALLAQNTFAQATSARKTNSDSVDGPTIYFNRVANFYSKKDKTGTLTLRGEPEWTKIRTGRLAVKRIFLPIQPPKIQFAAEQIPLCASEVNLKSSFPFETQIVAAALIEVSKDPAFPVEHTRITMDRDGRATWHFRETGNYYYRTRGVNAENQITERSETHQITVTPCSAVQAGKAATLAESKLKRKEKTKRTFEPLPENKFIALAPVFEQREPSIHYTRYEYNSSYLALETSAYLMVSRQVEDATNTFPRGVALALHSLNWIDEGQHGIEMKFESKVSGGNETTPISGEARYHHRWIFPWNFLSDFQEMQFSLLLGYEAHENPSKPYFSPHYNLLKTGFTINFPFLSRMDSGGEILYGQDAQNSHKYEVSGHLNYYYYPDWSVGIGYRVNVFEAGAFETAPNPENFPFREGRGESYLSLKFRY